MGVVQYDFEFGTNNIPAMCETIGNGTTPYLGLAKFFASQSSSCNDILYNDFIASLRNTTYDPAQNMRQVIVVAGARISLLTQLSRSGRGRRAPNLGEGNKEHCWSCSADPMARYFQTTDSAHQPFAYGNQVPLSYYNRMCSDAFSSTFDVQASVTDTNQRFGGNDLPPYYATNIAYDNSIVDPWHTLSVQHDVNPASRLFLYDVRGHCAAVSPPQPSDPVSIKNVRTNIAREINKWIVA